MINVINILVVLCLIFELVLVFQYAYSVLTTLSSDLFNGLTKALSVRFLGGALLHSYLAVGLFWSFFIGDDPGKNAVILFLLSLFMILFLLSSVNTYFYYLVRKEIKKNDKQTIRDDESSLDPSIESPDKQ